MNNKDPKEKPRQKAAALKYDGAGAPKIVAKGEGHIAGRIQEIAEKHQIPLVQDALLTGLLCNVPLQEEIPESLYVAVAEVLVHIYNIGDKFDESV